MFSLFTRNYVGTFIGMLFFGSMFFSNLDMVFQTQSILTEIWIPNFVWWLLPLMLFLYFSMFLIFQTRLLLGHKKAKKSLKLLFLLVSILYWLISLILLYFTVSWYDYMLLFLSATILLAFKNFYYHIKVKHKQYFWKLKIKTFLKEISIFWIIIALTLIIFSRSLSNVDIPENYFNIEAIKIWQDEEVMEIYSNIEFSKYIWEVSVKKYKKTNYDIVIYNLPDYILENINDIYLKTLAFPTVIQDKKYSYNYFVTLQKINLVKFEYEMLHNNIDDWLKIVENILLLNEKLKENSDNFSNIMSYIDIETQVLERIKKYKINFNKEQEVQLSKMIFELDTKELWKTAIQTEFNYHIAQLSLLYNIPLFLDKTEMLKVSLFTEYLHAENLEKIEFKNITRKNYLWLYYLESIEDNFDLQYQKLLELVKLKKELKNTLN